MSEEVIQAIEAIDTEPRDSWKQIVLALESAGWTPTMFETELAVSRFTLGKWRSGQSAPREMTRRLLKRAIVEMLKDPRP